MPNMNPNKGAAKRFRITRTGKVRHRKAWGAHLMKSKSASRQMRLKGTENLPTGDSQQVRKMLGS